MLWSFDKPSNPKIPVYAGCSQPILSNKQHASDYHGKDGLADVPDPDAPGLELVQKKNGVKALVKMVKKNQGEVRQARLVFIMITCQSESHSLMCRNYTAGDSGGHGTVD